MNKIEKNYTIEHHQIGWIVWENIKSEHGSGCFQMYVAKTKKKCTEFCRENGISITKKIDD